MGDAFIGTNVDVTFAGTSLKGKVTEVSIEVTAGEPDVHDVTASGDTERQELVGMKAAVRSNITVTSFDEVAGVSPAKDLNVNDTGALVAFPEGDNSGKESITWSTAYFLGMTERHGINEPSTAEIRFFALDEPTRGSVV